MNFSLPSELHILREKDTQQFVAEQVMPQENDARQSRHGPDQALCRELLAHPIMVP